ncbi:MAG: hypothetical protein HY912_17020 [Desulfomonile tiedjei]|uniref:Uncharacterized protein n=1 Tax=Desulfomonile tiedjei TaxID=2358 RepID=A0A9D6V5P4_9BACT|nr:hypothetical protein [Desulfomonile tiedjei]
MGCEIVEGIRFVIADGEDECQQMARGKGDIVFVRESNVFYFALGDGTAVRLAGELIDFRR